MGDTKYYYTNVLFKIFIIYFQGVPGEAGLPGPAGKEGSPVSLLLIIMVGGT